MGNVDCDVIHWYRQDYLHQVPAQARSSSAWRSSPVQLPTAST